KVDVLVAVTRLAALAARRATTTIPIIFLVVPDPIESNLVASLARPGGNATGYSSMTVELIPKRIELFKRAVPDISLRGLLVNVNNEAAARRNIEAAQQAAVRYGITIQPVEVRSADDFNLAFSSLNNSRAQGLVLTQDGLFYANLGRIAQLA